MVVKVFYHSNHPWMRSRSRLKLCLFALFLLAAGYGIYSYLVNNGFNPDWSIAKAKKWCKYRKWVKVRIVICRLGRPDPFPLYSIIRADGCGQSATISLLFIILLGHCLSANQLYNNGEIVSLVLSRQPCTS